METSDARAATPQASPPVNATPPVQETEKGIATVAYIFTWLTGLIILLVAKKEQRYARWNAVQAIAVGIVVTAIYIVLEILGTVLGIAAGLAATLLVGLLGLVFWVGTLVLVIMLAVKAYQGTPLRLPVLAAYADKYA